MLKWLKWLTAYGLHDYKYILERNITYGFVNNTRRNKDRIYVFGRELLANYIKKS